MPFLPLLLPLRRLAAAAGLLAAVLPAAQAQTPYVPVMKQYGDFVVTRDRHDPLVNLSFRKHGYWPGGAREVVEVRPLKATRDGQPMLLAFTKGYTGQGTILIGVQNGVPLMRPVSPLRRDDMVRTERDPEWGVPQPGRSEILLFARDGRALDTDSGELLWFDMPGIVTGDYAPAMLVSVSPDSRRGAYLVRRATSVEVVVATRDDGVAGVLALPPDTYQRWLKPLSQVAGEQAGAAIKARQGRTDSNRIQRELELAWFGQQFQWTLGKNDWQVTGLGLSSVPPEGEQP
ncbi:hypothetical protein [Janthinobacterium violaceinigrum]|uniref:Uncharacterized protein n=1 Tax=Janthinobacterium violaceinigrum TaxID=2654252 RepID=A0A6I1I783_9BURK|nr:hypothetical protein [Janthinobacterium violaceinigrum]KAB8066852.1 hypothetical protein GCN75_00880 [Janthinobacterium violaceinigrum]